MIHGRDIGALALEVSTGTARASRLHGPAHWRCVYRIAGLICAATPKADPIVCAYFSALHDTQRLSDGTDPEHGRRAAQVVRGLGPRLGLTAKQMSVLVEAIRDHADGRTTKHRTVGACWDADRLTLSRVGIAPDRRHLSSPDVIRNFDRWKALGGQMVSGPDIPWSQLSA
jgi:uncharacterized protein